MDGSLLELLSRSLYSVVVGRQMGSVKWISPVLSIPLGRRDKHLVAILGFPGPFCYLADGDPFQGVPAPARFTQLAGARVTGVKRADERQRILRLDVETAGEMSEALRLDFLLFGSAGRAELTHPDRGLLQAVGGRLSGTAGGTSSPVFSAPEYFLISHGRLGRVRLSVKDEPEASHRLGPFRDAVSACRQVGDRLLDEAHRLIVGSRAKPLYRRLSSQRRLLSKLEDDLTAAADHERVRREAETLAAYQSRISQNGANTIELPDVYRPERTLTIALDPALPIRVQIERRFKRAAKLARSQTHIRRRIDELRHGVSDLDQAISAIESTSSFSQAMAEMERCLANLPVPHGVGPSRRAVPKDKAGSFRRFELDSDWFVLVGKSNEANDELTFHRASPSDLWFHAQHVSGSHVVLKSRGRPGAPPNDILERAAALAAFYSKARHSALVPVIYTQRKYVRKPRGAKPGQVVCEREKLVMVAPALPPEMP